MSDKSLIEVPVSPGELIDKITILEIKSERIEDSQKLENVRRELRLLNEVRKWNIQMTPELEGLETALKAVNERIWIIEDDIRDLERRGDFDGEFIAVARSVYRTNDERAALKKQINSYLGSQIVEEKSYKPY